MENKRLLNGTADQESAGSLPKKSLTDKDDRGFFAKYKWWLAGLGVLVIIAIILGVTLGGSDDPVPPGPAPGPQPKPIIVVPGYNPYNVSVSANNDNVVSGIIVANVTEMERQAHLHPLTGDDDNKIKASPKIIPRGVNNNVVKNVAFEFGQTDFRTAYLRLSNANASRFSIP